MVNSSQLEQVEVTLTVMHNKNEHLAEAVSEIARSQFTFTLRWLTTAFFSATGGLRALEVQLALHTSQSRFN